MYLKILLVFSLMFSVSYAENVHKNNEYSIKILESEKSNVHSQSLMMYLPPSDGFSPNVNIQKQFYEGTLQEYSVLSIKQFKQMRFELINSKVTDKFLTFEYKGSIQGRNLYWYAKVYKKDDIVYLVTATCTVKQKGKVIEHLKECVNSFNLNKKVGLKNK